MSEWSSWLSFALGAAGGVVLVVASLLAWARVVSEPRRERIRLARRDGELDRLRAVYLWERPDVRDRVCVEWEGERSSGGREFSDFLRRRLDGDPVFRRWLVRRST